MKITIFAAGSQGDIQPCLALGKGLQRAGYRVTLAAPEDFADFIHKNGVAFYPLRGDVQKIMASDTAREFMETAGSNPFKSMRAMRTLISPVMMRMVDDAYQASRAAQGLICLGVFSPFGRSIADKLNIPLINIEPTPLLPTRDFPAASWPIQRNLGGVVNTLSGFAMLGVVWQWYRPFVAEFREQLDLPPCKAACFYRALRSTPLLGAYSPHLIPHPADWPSRAHVTGYFFLDAASDWKPAPGLEAFLEAGDPPVYIGFGSMSTRDPEALAGLILEAIAASGQRAVLLTGWGGLQAQDIGEDIYVLDRAPHSWLFPRMAAVVHHGGAGTTAEGLRAGAPTVILPFAFDQEFWGARVRALGIGPDPIPHKKLTADRLARAIHQAATDPGMRQRAESLGAAIRSEQGLDQAVQIVKGYFGPPDDDQRE